MPKKKSYPFVPFLLGGGILILLLIKLPGVTALFTPFDCSRCTIGAPLVTWMGAGYFAGLLSLIYLVPRFFSRAVASVGLIWAIAMGTLLLWFSPAFCYICFLSHLLHVGIWGYLLLFPGPGVPFNAFFLKKFLFAVQIGLFTFLAYFLIDEAVFKFSQEPKDSVPQFSFATMDGRKFSRDDLAKNNYVVLQFTLPSCKYCKKQLPVLDSVAKQWRGKRVRFFNIITRRNQEPLDELKTEMAAYSPHMEIVIDNNFEIGKLFDVRSFPTLYVIDVHGHIVKRIIGTFSNLQTDLDDTLKGKRK